jgi:hypothetical protein
MNHLERSLLSHVPDVVKLQKLESKTIRERISAAIQRVETASLDHYDSISVLSAHWAEDETGASEDSEIFNRTISKLHINGTTVDKQVYVLKSEDVKVLPYLDSVRAQVGLLQGRRKLFILHYAGHGFGEGASNLIFTSKASHETPDGLHFSFTLIRDALKLIASTSEGLDILMVLDCCCAAIAGRGNQIIGERVELMAATSDGGLSNQRVDGPTFTMNWCAAFDKFFDAGKPFSCDEIVEEVNSTINLEQYSAIFVVREGWGIPITFRTNPQKIALPSLLSSPQTVITALHVVENPGSTNLQILIKYLEKAPVPITVLASLPMESTLLLLRVPAYLQEMLVLPRVALFLVD